MAVATKPEEIVLAAGLIYNQTGWPWFECKRAAAAVFTEADKQMDLARAFRCKPGVPEVFSKLRKAGISAGILTSDGKEQTTSCMKLIGVLEQLEFIITPESVEHGKPAPDMAFKACHILSIESQELAIVGDSIVDMKMARAAGCLAVGLVTHPGSEELLASEADILIKSIEDIRL